jgi:hypothetical protein
MRSAAKSPIPWILLGARNVFTSNMSLPCRSGARRGRVG